MRKATIKYTTLICNEATMKKTYTTPTLVDHGSTIEQTLEAHVSGRELTGFPEFDSTL